MHIIWIVVVAQNLVPSFVNFQRLSAGMEEAARLALWERLYERPNQELLNAYFTGFGSRLDLSAALDKLDAIAPRLEQVADITPALLVDVVGKVEARFGWDEFEPIPFVVLVGTFGSSAWTTTVGGRQLSFIAAELLPRVPVDGALIAHETAHGIHHRMRTGDWQPIVGLKLFEEAIAMASAELECPSCSDLDLVAFGGENDAWLSACEQSWASVRSELRNVLMSNDPTDLGWFFARPERRPAGASFPHRIGYYAALVLARKLVTDVSLRDMVGWDPTHALTTVNTHL
ncbi:MAG TPA: hypothetical protein DCF65_12230 [Chloroflexi bacterium]|nr:hypothetical protein [Chloroflexota bacterium]HAF20641.1 hypothetical protein [Chloroflexota bacterium]